MKTKKMEKTILTELIKEQEQTYKDDLFLFEELCFNDFKFKEYHWEKEEYKRRFNNYKGDRKQKIFKFRRWLKSQHDKKIELITKEYNEIMQQDEFVYRKIIITVEWKKSHMWGMNPNASCSYGYSSGSVGGCGFDKLSTAVASVLNQHKEILKLMYEIKNAELNKKNVVNGIDLKKKNHEIFGYGSGYGIKPYFEGGTGVECYNKILNKIGLSFKQIVNTKNTDVFIIERLQNEN